MSPQPQDSRLKTQDPPRDFIAVLLSGSALLSLLGCQKALFPKDQPRTQFEIHERLRGSPAPTEIMDVFGTPQPDLRARLSRD